MKKIKKSSLLFLLLISSLCCYFYISNPTTINGQEVNATEESTSDSPMDETSSTLESSTSTPLLDQQKKAIKKATKKKQPKGPADAIEFTVKREGSKFVLTNSKVTPSYTDIAAISIQMPAGLKLTLPAGGVPSGWQTYNDPTDIVINYLMTANNKQTDVKNFLDKISFEIVDETQIKGDILISIDSEAISTWIDPSGVVHYYKFVNETVSWYQAYNKAKQLKYKGLTGYLATITSVEEHNYIYDSIAKKPGWLGGIRAVNNGNKSRINDQALIDVNLGSYDITRDNWYWSAGPEAGQVFYIGKHYTAATVPAGAYAAWTGTEPNNRWHDVSEEYVLQFAKSGTKYWNDLGAANYTAGWNEGFYVEFSEYGSQVEIHDEKNSYAGAIPQKVKVNYIDETTNLPLAPSVDLGSTFVFGNPYDTTSLKTELPLYNFSKVVGNETGSYGDAIIEVSYYYKKKVANLTVKFNDEDGAEINAPIILTNQVVDSEIDLSENAAVALVVKKLTDNWYNMTPPSDEKNVKILVSGTTVTYTGKGLIGFTEYTKTMSFERGRITPFEQVLNYQSIEDFRLEILDNRGVTTPGENFKRGQFSVNATLTTPFTNTAATANKVLTTAELIYNDGAKDIKIDDSGAAIFNNKVSSAERKFEIKLDENGDPTTKGLRLKIPTGTGLELGTYHAEITWDLIQGP